MIDKLQPPQEALKPTQELPEPEANSPAVIDIYQLINQTIPKISQADSIDQVLELVRGVFDQAPFATIQFIPEGEHLKAVSMHHQHSTAGASLHIPDITISLEMVESSLSDISPLVINIDGETTLPAEMMNLLLNLRLRSAVLIPVWRGSHLISLYMLGASSNAELDPGKIQPYVSLAGQVSTAIDKVLALSHLQRRVAGLQSLASISQAISVIMDLDDLYVLIHEKIAQVMGEIDLAIALYEPQTDMISIPYAHEADQRLSLPPFPLGEGLTSILIRSQQPLLLVEDTEKRAIELGAKVSGAAAKSWLGVPLIVAGEVLGAIIVQDTEHEYRFDDNDLRLMTTLAAQVAITIRNLRLLDEAQRRAEQERMLSEINRKIWASPDVETIARTTLQELGRVLRVSHGMIRLHNASVDYPTFEAEQNDKFEFSQSNS